MYKNKCIKALILLLISSSLIQAMKIEKQSLFIPARLGDISVTHDQDSFHVTHDGQTTTVKTWQMDKELRGVSQDKLAKLLAAGAYLQVNQSGNNDYTLKLQQRLVGGGLFGANAGFFIGKFAVHFVAHGAITAVSLLTGPLAPATAAGLEACLLPFIEGASNVVGLGCGIVGGVATGPV